MSVECAIEGEIQHKQLHRTTDLTGSSTTCLRRRKESDATGECVTNHSPRTQFPPCIHLGESGNDISAAEDK